MKKRYVNLILAMVSASAMALGSVPAMAATDSAKTESAKNDSSICGWENRHCGEPEAGGRRLHRRFQYRQQYVPCK